MKAQAATEPFVVVEPLRHDGVRYRPGAEIELSAEAAAPLLRGGRVRRPGGGPDLAVQFGEFEGRVADDLQAVQVAREAAAKDLEAAKAEREAAAKDLEAAKAEREAAAKDLEAAKAERAADKKDGGKAKK